MTIKKNHSRHVVNFESDDNSSNDDCATDELPSKYHKFDHFPDDAQFNKDCATTLDCVTTPDCATTSDCATASNSESRVLASFSLPVINITDNEVDNIISSKIKEHRNVMQKESTVLLKSAVGQNKERTNSATNSKFI